METSRISIFPLLYNYWIEKKKIQNTKHKTKQNNFKTCDTIREDFNPDNVAISLWLVFMK